MLKLSLNTILLIWYISSDVYTYDNEFQCSFSDQVIISNLSACQERDCSQGKRNPKDSYFDCSIGMFGEWEEFRQNNRVLESYKPSVSQMKMNPPSISAIGFYLIADKNSVKNNPNLNLTFRLPRNSTYDTKALLVKFVGMNDSRYPDLIDPYYKDNPRYRLFDFPLYKTPEEDKLHPREIVYGCFMGLDCQKEKRVYLFTLTAFTMDQSHPGTSITYHFTVYTQRHTTNSGKLTVAMAYMYKLRAMHVVFEPMTADHVSSDTHYAVKLMEINTGKLQFAKIGPKTRRYEHEFPNVAKGSYIVEVTVRNCIGINPCPISQSGIVEVVNQEKMTLLTTTKTTETSLEAGAYAIIGVVGGVVLLLVLFVCFMVSIDYKPKVYILNSCEERTHTDVSMALKQCIHRYYDTEIVSTVNSDADLSNKAGFQNHDNIIIATVCHHVTTAFVEKLCSNQKLKRSKNITCICFSQTDFAAVPNVDKVFMWSQNNGCIDMLKYIRDKQKKHCMNFLKPFQPNLENGYENSAEIKNLQHTISLTVPAPTPANVPCPPQSYWPDDARQPLLHTYCPVHSETFSGWDNRTQPFNVALSSSLTDDPVSEYQCGPTLDHCHSELTRSAKEILSQKMLCLIEDVP